MTENIRLAFLAGGELVHTKRSRARSERVTWMRL